MSERSTTVTAPRPPAGGPARPGNAVIRGLKRAVRTFWHHLTSMRTALILLFLLAIASLPAALLPQWYLNEAKTAQYIVEHPTFGPLLDRLGFFDVVASPWYSAIYLALAISLIGCITPRTAELIAQWRAKPGRAPRNLSRLPHHAVITRDGSAEDVANEIRRALRHKGIGGWRTTVRTEANGAVTVSAERGYLREVGNLIFHVAVLGLLFTMAIGSLYGYTGSVLVEEGRGFCSSAPVAYDNFAPGRMVDGTEMTPFCVNVNKFEAEYDDNGMAKYYRARLGLQVGEETASTDFRAELLNINEPLRIDGQRLYLLGHGYVPEFTVRYPSGAERTYSAPFEPKDSMFTSEGVVKITDPPGYPADELRSNQLAIVGVFAPSGIVSGGILTSAYPELLAPAVAVEIYRGDLGLEHGAPQSIFAIDTTQVDNGELVLQDRANLNFGESLTLDDGTEITFSGAKDFVSLQTSYDPVQGLALLFAILLIGGIFASLTIKRRRVWYRVSDGGGAGLDGAGAGADGGDAVVDATDADSDAAMSDRPPTVDRSCTIEIGGLARTDQAGYGAEFDSLVALAGGDTAAVKER